MEYLKIRNWDRWQSYRKDRGQPPWIKVHRRLMRNPEWVSLTDSERGQLVAIWLLAADRDGAIPASPELIQKLCYMDSPPDLNKFIQLDFVRQGDANVTPTRRQSVTPKAEAEAEAEAEKNHAFGGHFQAQVGECFEDIKKTCERLKLKPQKNGNRFNPYQWVQAQVNNQMHPGAINETLQGILKHWDNIETNPWQYSNALIKTKSQNYNEREAIQIHEQFKDMKVPELRTLTAGLFKEI